MRYIGVDLGTSAVKLLLMRADGTIERIVSKEYPLYFPKPGWSEQNPEDWWNGVIEGLKDLLKESKKEEIAGISFSGQMHGLVVLDKEDKVIRPAILWNDGRTGEENRYLNETIGKEKIAAYTGNISFSGFTAPKLLWVKNKEPENFNKIHKIMLPKDYISYRLTGVHCTDVSDASGTLLMDVKNKCWSKEMLKICHIRQQMLPEIMESSQIIGTLKKEVAVQLGLSEKVKIAAGAGDNAAAAIGTGTVGHGACNISLGTSGTVFIASDHFVMDENNALHSFAHADGTYHLMGCMLSAASCSKWWMEQIIGTQDYTKEQEKIVALGKNHVFFLPYLMGERSPHNDENARGTFIGMTMNTKREDMTQAVLEGVAFALRDLLEVARSLKILVTRTKICGGGAKSALWREIIANVLNTQVEVVENEEGPAYGAAILAAVSCGEFENTEQASKQLVKRKQTIFPKEKLVNTYEKQYQKFKKIYPFVKELFKELS